MRLAYLFILLKAIKEISCNGPGTLFVQLMLYQNPSGKTEKGKDCDSWFHQFVNDRCDLVFNICVKNADTKLLSTLCDVGCLSTLGHVYMDTQRVVFGPMIGFIPNPFNFSLTSMPENVKLAINITDDDPDGQELISQLDHSIQLPLIIDNDSSNINKIVLSSKYSELSFKVFGRCADNYYGPGCRRFCKPSFSRDTGNYACDKVTGEKHCLIGWTGENCRQRDVCLISNPCHGSSRCLMNDSIAICECPPSLKGRYCDHSVRPCDTSPCINGGLCVRNNGSGHLTPQGFVCNCPHNFTGSFCEFDVNECDRLPSRCENGAACVNVVGSYYCVCRNNYWGIHCEKPPVYSVQGIDGSYLYKSHESNATHNVIIMLLACVACLIIIIVTLSILYLKKRSSSLIVNNHLSDSNSSVYSQCHYEDIEGKLKVNDKHDKEEEDLYPNIYEQQPDELHVPVEICYDSIDKEAMLAPKCLSETTI